MKKLLTMIMLGGMILFAGCSNAPVDQTNTSPDTNTPRIVKVGVIAPLSGPGSSYGEDISNVYEDAVQQFNTAQENITLQLIVEDGKCEGKSATTAALKLINIDKVDLILGGVCSSETIAAGKIAQKNNVLLVSSLSSSPEISNIGEYVYRFWNDAFAALKLGKHLVGKYENIAVLTEKSDFPLALKQEFIKIYTGDILDIDFSSDEKDFDVITQNIKKASVDAIVLFTQSEDAMIPMIKSFDTYGLLKEFEQDIFGAYYFSNENFLNALGEKANGLIQVSLDMSSDSSQKGKEYIDHFTDIYKEFSDVFYVLVGKESIDVVIDGIKQGNYTSEQLKTYLEKIDQDNPRTGYFGEYYFNNQGDGMGIKFIIQQIQSGQVVPVE